MQLLALIGETLEGSETAKGVVVERKRLKTRKAASFRLWVWTTEADEAEQLRIGYGHREMVVVAGG